MSHLKNDKDVQTGKQWWKLADAHVEFLVGSLQRLLEIPGFQMFTHGAAILESVLQLRRESMKRLRKYGIGYKHGPTVVDQKRLRRAHVHEVGAELFLFTYLNSILESTAVAWEVVGKLSTERHIIATSEDGSPINAKNINVFRQFAVIAYCVQKLMQERMPAVLSVLLGLLDDERSIRFLAGMVSSRLSISQRWRLGRALAREYSDTTEGLLQEALLEIAAEYPNIKTDIKNHGFANPTIASLHRTVGKAIAKVNDERLSFEEIDDLDPKYVQSHIDPAEELMAKEGALLKIAKRLNADGALSLRQFEILSMDLVDIPESEIAQSLGITTGTVNYHRHAYKANLRKAADACPDDFSL